MIMYLHNFFFFHHNDGGASVNISAVFYTLVQSYTFLYNSKHFTY